ncbi:helix-turn-helix domain-containing protein [Mycoplasma corogypsi]|uniref:helix-turn-helix domain-containing protein n=1 Tax=Mycoplasma corogypsi TaxID=2106 RepID=UPI0038734DBC
MQITYKKLWKLLIDKNLKKTDLINLAKISSVTLSRLSKDESVSVETLNRICKALDCQIGDIISSKDE